MTRISGDLQTLSIDCDCIKHWLEIQIVDECDKPLANIAYQLKSRGNDRQGVTDADGWIKERDLRLQPVRLTLSGQGLTDVLLQRTRRLEGEPSPVQQRTKSLGWHYHLPSLSSLSDNKPSLPPSRQQDIEAQYYTGNVGEGVVIPTSQQRIHLIELPVINKGLTLVIGMFFDGTGNNSMNVAEGAQCQTANELQGTENTTNQQCIYEDFSDSRQDSYKNYYTNVWFLYELYFNDCEKGLSTDISLAQGKIYIEGIGTEQGKPDTLFGLGTGRGETGVVAKVAQGIKNLEQWIKTFLEKNPDIVIDALKFDVFGFSRGAAAARHFVNLVNDSDKLGVNNPLYQALDRVLNDAVYPQKRRGLQAKVRFFGPFDTVAAIAAPSNLWNPHSESNPGVSLQLPAGSAEGVLHITAMHECRYNFSLNSLRPHYQELCLPGVHSDIGGSYRAKEVEQVFLSKPWVKNVEWQSTDITTLSIYTQAKKELAFLRKHPLMRWMLPELEIDDRGKAEAQKRAEEESISEWLKILTGVTYSTTKKNDSTFRYQAFTALAMKRTVSNGWAKVVLRVMLEAAQHYGVKFSAINEELVDYHIPDELQPLKEKALAQSQALRTGAFAEPFTEDELMLLCRKYIHCSANFGQVKLLSNSKETLFVPQQADVVYVNRPNGGWRRASHPLNGKINYD